MFHRPSLLASVLVFASVVAPACDRPPEPTTAEVAPASERTDTKSSDPGDPSAPVVVKPDPGNEAAAPPAGSPLAEAVPEAEAVPPAAEAVAPTPEAEAAPPAAEADAVPTATPATPRSAKAPTKPDASRTPGRSVKAFTDCKKSETFADGRCYPSHIAACEALSCSGQCFALRSMPPQAKCNMSKGQKPSAKGRVVSAFTDCKATETFAGRRCYLSFEAACDALACSGKCMQLKSMPPQAKCTGA